MLDPIIKTHLWAPEDEKNCNSGVTKTWTHLPVVDLINRTLRPILNHLAEIGAFIAATLLSPFAFTFNPTKLPPGTKKVTILVHGFLHNSSAWIYLKHKLSQQPDLGPIFTINLGHPFQSINSYTETLAKQIESIRKMTDDGNLEVNLVGHSMGGLVSSNYAVNIAKSPQIHVNKVVTIVSPLKGSSQAKYLQFFPCVKNMLPNGDFIKTLGEKVKHLKNTTFFHIGCGIDLIVPSKNSYFETKEKRFEFPNLGHLGCLYSSSVANCLIKELQSKSK